MRQLDVASLTMKCDNRGGCIGRGRASTQVCRRHNCAEQGQKGEQ